MSLLFFDLDGTLLIDGEISNECRRQMRRVKEQGNDLILNTGRSPAFLPPKIRRSPLFDGMICGSAYIEYKNRVLENLTLDAETLKSAYLWGKESGLCVVFEGVSENFSVNGDLPDAGRMFDRSLLPEITKVTMWCPPVQVKQEDFPGLSIVHFKNYAEGIHPGRDKSSGMKTLLAHLNQKKEDCWAFGDSENDIDMLRCAGHAVCMPSAPDEFDSFCFYRAKERDGVPEALKKFF